MVSSIHGRQETLRKHLGSQGEHRFPSQQDREAGRAARERVEGVGRRGEGQGWSALGRRLLGFVYLGGRRRGGLAVGGLRAKASSFGDGGGRGWVLGGRRGADYDRGGHGEVGSLCGEGLLAPLLQRAAHSGSEATPRTRGLHTPTPCPRRCSEEGGGGNQLGGTQKLDAKVRGLGAPGSRGSDLG